MPSSQYRSPTMPASAESRLPRFCQGETGAGGDLENTAHGICCTDALPAARPDCALSPVTERRDGELRCVGAGAGAPWSAGESGPAVLSTAAIALRNRGWRCSAIVLSGGALMVAAACGLLSDGAPSPGVLAFGGIGYEGSQTPVYGGWSSRLAQYGQYGPWSGQMLAPSPSLQGSYQVRVNSPSYLPTQQHSLRLITFRHRILLLPFPTWSNTSTYLAPVA